MRCPHAHDVPIKPGADFCGDQTGGLPQSHNGLAALVKNELRKEPFTGAVFVFRAKRADRLKLLY